MTVQQFNEDLPDLTSCTIAVIGLGYVGLPLAVQFAVTTTCHRSQKALNRTIVGYDTNKIRINELNSFIDKTNEVSMSTLQEAHIRLTAAEEDIYSADVFIVTVPTPIDDARRPNLCALEAASRTVGRALRARANSGTKPLVVFESTVYPGVTEDTCIPIIENTSSLLINEDFYCGYSPERINPGDKTHTLANVVKVTSGSSRESALWIDSLYGSIVKIGTHLAPSICVAEAAKVIENTQRDLNIALINELSIIFSKMSIDTLDVLEAAGTKWNFLKFQPGLVGGHCIGVDPYYLTHKAEQLGYHPEVVLAGRRINDSMASWVCNRTVLAIAEKKIQIVGSTVLILGFSFKENCPDFRNTKVWDLVNSLHQYGLKTLVVDPYVDVKKVKEAYDINILQSIPQEKTFDAVLLAVAHSDFAMMDKIDWQKILKPCSVIVDIKGIIPRSLDPIRI